KAAAGSTMICSARAMKTALGCLATRAKSATVRLRPSPSMMIPRATGSPIVVSAEPTAPVCPSPGGMRGISAGARARGAARSAREQVVGRRVRQRDGDPGVPRVLHRDRANVVDELHAAAGEPRRQRIEIVAARDGDGDLAETERRGPGAGA